jgi:hypothetical protein
MFAVNPFGVQLTGHSRRTRGVSHGLKVSAAAAVDRGSQSDFVFQSKGVIDGGYGSK